MKTGISLFAMTLLGVLAGSPAYADDYKFKGGYPTPETVRKAYDSLDLNRAIQTYRIFYPTVSGYAMLKGNEKIGIFPNKVSGTLDTQPKHIGYTLNSDTPYAPLFLDLSNGPMVVELPAGPLICIAMDINQRWSRIWECLVRQRARVTKSCSCRPAIRGRNLKVIGSRVPRRIKCW